MTGLIGRLEHRTLLRLLLKEVEPSGPANGRQPVREVAILPSRVAGSRR
jgi:hypothetical protein